MQWLDDYPPQQRRALEIHLDEIERQGFSALTHAQIAIRAGCGRSTVVSAVATALARRQIIVLRREGEQNVVKLPARRFEPPRG